MLLILLSSALFYLAFPNRICIYGFWPCIWFFAVPLLLALRGQSCKRRTVLGLLFGMCAYGLMAQGLMVISPAAFLAFVLALSIQALVFAILCRSSGSLFPDSFYFPCAWIFSEWVRNSLTGGFSFYISHALSFCPLMLGLFSLLGAWGMSGIILAVNFLIYAAIIHQPYRWACVISAGVIFLAVVVSGVHQVKSAGASFHQLRLGIIQGNISPLEKMDLRLFDHNASLHLGLTELSFKRAHPDLVVWPETAYPDDLLQDSSWHDLIFAEAWHMNADLLTGMAPIINGKEYNSALLINAQGQAAGLYHKQALVPFAETTPLEKWGIHWGRGYHFCAGDKPGLFTLSHGAGHFGVVICSESAHPNLVRQLRKAGADFLVEISNDGWFKDDASCMLHAQAAIMRAVENRMWVVRAANTGFSFAVDPNGTIHRDPNLKLGREGYGIFDIMIRNS